MLNKNKTGLSLGVSFAVFHFIWSLVVFVGLGQWAMDLAFKLHYLANPFTIRGFTALRFIGLMVMTFVAGYIVGWIFAAIWNWSNKKTA